MKTRAEHWVEAERLLVRVKDRLERSGITQSGRDILLAAQVHATLAAAPEDVMAGVAYLRDPVNNVDPEVY
jgi:hypothetical protein